MSKSAQVNHDSTTTVTFVTIEAGPTDNTVFMTSPQPNTMEKSDALFDACKAQNNVDLFKSVYIAPDGTFGYYKTT